MALDWEFPTLLNLMYAGIPAFCNNSFKTNVKSASDFWVAMASLRNITLLFSGSIFIGLGEVLFRF